VRQGAYRLLGALLLYPDEITLAALPEVARSLRRQGRWWTAGLAFYGPWDQLLRRIEGLAPAQMQELQEAHLDLFG